MEDGRSCEGEDNDIYSKRLNERRMKLDGFLRVASLNSPIN